MPGRVDFSADLILICNSPEAGGIERVDTTPANEWARRGRKVCVATLHDRRRFFKLDPAVHNVVVDRAGLNRIADAPRWLATRLRGGERPGLWLLNVIFGGLHHLSYKQLYRAYSRPVYAGEAVFLPRALAAWESVTGLTC